MINIKSDSRKVKSGDIFVALNGISSDGHDYVYKAINNGASKIIAERGNYEGVDYEIVENSRKYLNDYLANNYKKYLDEMVIIGITGTNGKTTTAYLIYEALNKLGKKCCYIGTIGYYLDRKIYSLPNTSPDVCEIYDMMINAYDNGYRYIVIEASSQGLSYDRFNGIEFDYAIFTNLTIDHLDYHKTMENYALAKQTLFKKNKGINIVNNDDDYSDYFKINDFVTYGFNDSDYQIIDYKLSNYDSLFKIKYHDQIINVDSRLIGKHNIYNMICVFIVLDLLEIKHNDIIDIIPKLHAPDGRMDIIKYNNNAIVIDYAHTPDAMENIYKTIKEITKGNIYTVFGCTGDRDRSKRPIMMNLACTSSKYVFVTSDDLHNEDFNQIIDDMLKGNNFNNFDICMDRSKAIKKGIDLLDDNDILLILGKGHEDFIIVKDKNIPFNDKKEVKKILDKIKIG